MASEHASSRTPIVKLHGPEDLLAAIPGMLGYVPENSVVMVAAGSRSQRVSKCVRGDLPPPEHYESLAEQLAVVMAEEQPSLVDTIVVGGGSESDNGELPGAALVASVLGKLAAFGVRHASAYWVRDMAEGSPWRSYSDPRLCGSLPDPASSRLATELTGLGHVTFGSRAELEALFRPDAEALLEKRSQLIDKRVDELAEWTPDRGAEVVRAAVRASSDGTLALTDDQIAELAIALIHGGIRDSCLATALPAETPLARSAARLWQALSRSLPAPERAEAASLAAFAAYQSGDGALAGIALDVALDANPSHVLSKLLDRALSHGLHPRELTGLAQYDEIGLCAQLRAAAA